MSVTRFVPECGAPSVAAIDEMVRLFKTFKHFVVMTGAGISTESGIPDYRSPKVGQYARTNRRPVLHGDFMSSLDVRRRYWSRNYVAWPRFHASEPNETHKVCAAWEHNERFTWLITQNVDGLHRKAGSRRLTELHGSATRVVCMKCQKLYSRELMQQWLTEANPDWTVRELGELAPDGDCDIPDSAAQIFNVPHCPNCGPKSILKTDVVFFGGMVPPSAHAECAEAIGGCDGLLVLGSSLTVMTGYHYVSDAACRGVPVLIVNIGPTAADDLATLKLPAKCTDIMKHLANI